MASKVLHVFGGGDRPLDRTDTGQPYKFYSITDALQTPRIRSGYGYAPKPQSAQFPFAAVNAGAGGQDAVISAQWFNEGGYSGQSLYFRVVDERNWWRLSHIMLLSDYTYVSGYTEPTYSYVGTGTYYYDPPGPWVYTGSSPISPTSPNYGKYEAVYSNYDSRVGQYLSRFDYSHDKYLYYQTRTVSENQTLVQTGGGEPIYSTATSSSVHMVLQKKVNDTLVTVADVNTGGSSPTSMSVHCEGVDINCYTDLNTDAFWSGSDPSNRYGTRHGWGSSHQTAHGFEKGFTRFEVQPFNLQSYLPGMIV